MQHKTSLALAVFAAAICLSSSPAFARLGDEKNQAEMYMRTREARAPQVVLDDKGKVVWEHWPAPKEWWTTAEADKVRDLLAQDEKPYKRVKDGQRFRFLYRNGSVVEYILGDKSKVAGVTAYTKDYPRHKTKKPIQFPSFAM